MIMEHRHRNKWDACKQLHSQYGYNNYKPVLALDIDKTNLDHNALLLSAWPKLVLLWWKFTYCINNSLSWGWRNILQGRITMVCHQKVVYKGFLLVPIENSNSSNFCYQLKIYILSILVTNCECLVAKEELQLI